jgi:hypothetical protein
LATVKRRVLHLAQPLLITALVFASHGLNDALARDAVRLRHHILLRAHYDRQIAS